MAPSNNSKPTTHGCTTVDTSECKQTLSLNHHHPQCFDTKHSFILQRPLAANCKHLSTGDKAQLKLWNQKNFLLTLESEDVPPFKQNLTEKPLNSLSYMVTTTLQHSLLPFIIHYYPSTFPPTIHHSLLPFRILYYHSSFTTTLQDSLLPYHSSFTTTIQDSLLPYHSSFTTTIQDSLLPYHSSFTTTLQDSLLPIPY